jgi:hypothetical protein
MFQIAARLLTAVAIFDDQPKLGVARKPLMMRLDIKQPERTRRPLGARNCGKPGGLILQDPVFWKASGCFGYATGEGGSYYNSMCLGQEDAIGMPLAQTSSKILATFS